MSKFAVYSLRFLQGIKVLEEPIVQISSVVNLRFLQGITVIVVNGVLKYNLESNSVKYLRPVGNSFG